MILEGEIEDVKMSSVSSEVQKLITHKFPLYFLHELLIKSENYHKTLFTPLPPPPQKKTHAHIYMVYFFTILQFFMALKRRNVCLGQVERQRFAVTTDGMMHLAPKPYTEYVSVKI